MSDWVDIRLSEADNRLLFRYNPVEDIVQIGSRRQVHEICLAEYRKEHRYSEDSLTFNAEGARMNTGTPSVQS